MIHFGAARHASPRRHAYQARRRGDARPRRQPPAYAANTRAVTRR